MLLRCCLIYITIFILRHILYLVYLCPCLGLGLFMSYLCDLFFVFSLIFMVINHIPLFKQTYLLFAHFQNISYYFWMMKKASYFQIAKVQPRVLLRFSLIFCQLQPGVAYKSAAYIKEGLKQRGRFQLPRVLILITCTDVHLKRFSGHEISYTKNQNL